MNKLRGETLLAKDLHRILKAEKLIVGKVLFGFIVSRSEMRHQSIDPDVREAFGGLRKFGNFIGAHPQTSHPGIDLYMSVRGYFRIAGGSIERLDHIEPIDNRR